MRQRKKTRKAEEEQAEKEEAAKLKKMMAVFKSLEGEWVGKEKIDYNNELPGFKNKPDVEWNDEWKGFYTQNGRYFEMTGKTDGEMASTYHWYVTYDAGDEEYRAWSFGSTGYSEFSGELSDDGKSVLWTKFTDGGVNNLEDTFELRADGNKCKASGEMNIVSPDNEEVKINFYKQSSSYTRKKVEI
jgi:hypothetical protein